MPAFSSTATLNPILGETFSEFINDPGNGYVGPQIYPTFNSSVQNGQYDVWDEENKLNFPESLDRAPNSAYGRVNMQLSSDSFNTKDLGIEVPVDDTERDHYANAVDLDIEAAQTAASIVLHKHEKDVKAELEASAPSSAVTNWGTDAVATIQDNVHTGVEAIRLGVGVKPNRCFMTEETFFQLKQNANIVGQIQYTIPAGIASTLDAVANIIGSPPITLMGGIENSANAGQAVTPADIWSLNDVYLAVVNPASSLKVMNAGRTFVWTGGMGGSSDITVETYREEQIKSDIHRAWHYRGIKTTAASALYRFTSVLS